MNRYHRGSSTIVASRFGLAHVGAQLKVENPVPLRTIWNFDLLPSLRASLSLQRNAYLRRGFDQKSIKDQLGDTSADGDTNVARKKSAQPGGKGFIDENGGGPRVRLRKWHQKKT